jgi:hypothetical protein
MRRLRGRLGTFMLLLETTDRLAMSLANEGWQKKYESPKGGQFTIEKGPGEFVADGGSCAFGDNGADGLEPRRARRGSKVLGILSVWYGSTIRSETIGEPARCRTGHFC